MPELYPDAVEGPYTVPSGTDIADGPQAFRDFADSLGGLSDTLEVFELAGDHTVTAVEMGGLFTHSGSGMTLTVNAGEHPVGSVMAVSNLSDEADAVVTVETPNLTETVGQYAIMSFTQVQPNVWIPNGGGAGGGGGGAVGAAVIEQATGAVTKSSFTGDASIPGTETGQAYDVYTFTGSGKLIVSVPGLADVLVVGGGGGGARSQTSQAGRSAGGGGGVRFGLFDLPEGEITAAIGGGGSSSATTNSTATAASGGVTSFGNVLKVGGGGGGVANVIHDQTPASVTVGIGGGGSSGGYTNGVQYRDGAGAGGTVYGGDERAGIVINYDNKSTQRGVGGSQSSSGAGGANTGNGGGGNVGGGGSGIVIVRVKVATESYPFRSKTTAPRTAHAAHIENGIVRQVIVIPHLDDDDQKITEYCNSIGLPGTWVDTSYTGSRRGKYAGVGDTFAMTQSGGEFVSPEIEAAD